MNFKEFLVENKADKQIPVQYIVLHATSGPVSKVLDIFHKTEKSCHFIIDEDGVIHKTLNLYENSVDMGWHAGRSIWVNDQGKILSEFNDFSIGIELINKDCNLYEYPSSLMESLIRLIKFLMVKYPVLSKPGRIIGHEAISGFRGKVDPGRLFDWLLLYSSCYPDSTYYNKGTSLSPRFTQLAQNINLKMKEGGSSKELIQGINNCLNEYYLNKIKIGEIPN